MQRKRFTRHIIQQCFGCPAQQANDVVCAFDRDLTYAINISATISAENLPLGDNFHNESLCRLTFCNIYLNGLTCKRILNNFTHEQTFKYYA